MARTNDYESLLRRVERLETQVVRGRILAVAICGLLLVGTVAFATSSKEHTSQEIQARSFVVVDKDGEPRAIFGSESTGVSLRAFDRVGDERIRIEIARSSPSDNPRIILLDPANKRRLVLGSFLESTPDIDAFDHVPTASLVLFNEKGQVAWRTPSRLHSSRP